MRSFPIPPAHKSDTLLWAGIRPLASFPPVFKLCKVATASSVMPKIRICFYRSWLTTMALSFECLTRQHSLKLRSSLRNLSSHTRCNFINEALLIYSFSLMNNKCTFVKLTANTLSLFPDSSQVSPAVNEF